VSAAAVERRCQFVGKPLVRVSNDPFWSPVGSEVAVGVRVAVDAGGAVDVGAGSGVELGEPLDPSRISARSTVITEPVLEGLRVPVLRSRKEWLPEGSTGEVHRSTSPVFVAE
jgi:hypothetical protein